MFYIRVLNIPRAEWELMAVGELFDLAACWQIMHGAKEKAPEPEFADFIEGLE